MENQRIRISKSMLKTALITLLKEKPLNQISVYELCQVAQINRTTFYKYYGNQTDLLHEIETDLLTQLDEDLKNIVAQNQNPIHSVLNQLFEQRETFCILVNSLPSHDFASHLFALPSIRMIFQNMTDDRNYSDTEAKYIRQFVFQGTFSILYNWLNSQHPESVDEIAEVLKLLKNKL